MNDYGNIRASKRVVLRSLKRHAQLLFNNINNGNKAEINIVAVLEASESIKVNANRLRQLQAAEDDYYKDLEAE